MLTVEIYLLLITLIFFSLGISLILVRGAFKRIWDVDEFTGQLWKIWAFLEKLLLTLGFLFIPLVILVGIMNLFMVLV